MAGEITTLTAVQRAFSKQADHYDEDDLSNPILQDWRKRVYHHLGLFLGSSSRVLELNAGTGIDALYLALAGHTVHATDASPGMVSKIRDKIAHFNLSDRFSAQQCAFESIYSVTETPFDIVFSNFGGLNCCQDLALVTRHLPKLLNKGGYLTWVIMPPVCPWEWLQILKGNPAAFRRMKEGGTVAHLEDEQFTTYYHSVSDIQKSLGSHFRLIRAEGLGALAPPPSSLSFVAKNPGLYSLLKRIDNSVATHIPFNRWADHIIATFQFI